MIEHSATLAINERIARRRAAGQPVLHLGFGEAGLPVLGELAEVLRGAAGRNGYGPVAGAPGARAATAGFFGRRDLPTEAEQILLAPGSKALLWAALAALPGDLVLPAPSWVSYAAQADITGKQVIRAPIPESCGGIPDPERLDETIRAARSRGADPRILLLTIPDNPTGTAAGAELVKQVCAIAEEHELVLLSDEIYRELRFDPAEHLSPAELLPERTIVTGGLSKHLALGGWRIGFARLPDGALGDTLAARFTGLASELWSSLAAPMQAVVEYAMGEPRPVREYVAASRRLHESVSGAVHRVFLDAGARCRPPAAAFYCYPDLAELREPLAAQGIRSGVELTELLFERHGVGVLAGAHFGDDPSALRFRVASSLLYGETEEQRRETLYSANPVELPRIAEQLDILGSALTALG
ncbi:pyridoxal phosphate-dependent aminotransferase [Sciscionella sediminilitoris]|uniref:pyridoxal phosphate-dependent aminotransferase n=1 Tax=Sciscionella sediminilitoris TaxID=1445613 RepID=UPI0004DF14CF|nr:pyridoxal phosphate-dependent aminotransferase [Sciscionella sp. SE31]